MSHQFLFALALSGLILVPPLHSQGWDASHQATGWAFQEVDGSLVFFDPGVRSLRTWQKGSGLLATLPLALPGARKQTPAPSPIAGPARATSDYDEAGALLYGRPHPQRAPADPRTAAVAATIEEARPERWLVDSYSRTWMVCDGRLLVFSKDGRLENALPLPARVEDMAMGRQGILILYRTAKVYLEQRDLKTGAVLWSYGERAQVKEAAAQPLLVPLNRMALGGDGTVYLAEGASMAFTVLDPQRGPKEPGQTFFTCQDAIPARAVLGRLGRGPLLSWAGRDVIFGVFTPSQVKSCGAPESRGLLLARFDVGRGLMEWLPTPLSEGHLLVGLLDTEAVFVAPDGGLAFAPIR